MIDMVRIARFKHPVDFLPIFSILMRCLAVISREYSMSLNTTWKHDLLCIYPTEEVDMERGANHHFDNGAKLSLNDYREWEGQQVMIARDPYETMYLAQAAGVWCGFSSF